jgi:hypothetical protein
MGGGAFLSYIPWDGKPGGIVTNGTIQDSILGPGLYHSHFDEGLVGHATSFNISTMPSPVISQMTDIRGVPGAMRISRIRNLFTGGAERVPQAHFASRLDDVNNISYDYGSDVNDGNVRGKNVIGCVVKMGPHTRKAIFLTHAVKSGQKPFANSIYVGDALLLDRNGNPLPYKDDMAAVSRRTTPLGGGPYRVTVVPAADVMAEVLPNVGNPTRDAVDAELIASVAAGTGTWYNGVDFPEAGYLTPHWP